ncbi:MAG: oligosaccharide flippase family protein [Planctomycetes bacterium]|nr:oligosaccharide flippase family protein [Planctomycetota bacterium]
MAEDLTGRERLVSNVLFSWATYFVFIVAGFVMPRLIDRRLGQDLLGVWDFAWSVVSYFELVQAGVGASVNRYVARYRAVSDVLSINRVVSSATCILTIAGALVFGLTIAASLLLPHLFGPRLGPYALQAQWIVFFLGLSFCTRVAFGAFNGVLTGCHRWALHNVNDSAWHAATIAGMIVAVLSGGGLRVLAVIACVGGVAADVTRVLLAHRVCRGLRLRLSLVRKETIRSIFFFGGKTLLPSISQMLLFQTTSVLITGYLGPAALALYSRPQSLVRHVNALVNKMGMVLTPTTSSLQSVGDLEAVRQLLIKSVRYSLYLVLPMVLFLAIFGGSVMQLWMGPRYADGVVPAVLAVGFLTAMAQTPLRMILVGLNVHGRASVAELVASVCSIVLTVLTLKSLSWGLVGATIAVTLPLTIMNVVYLPLLVRSQLGLGVARYFWSVVARPAVHLVPFAVCLIAVRLVFWKQPMVGLLCAGGTATVILAVVYWRYVIPDRIKTRTFSYLAALKKVVYPLQ